jgi:mRNA interferase RelE/StbE
LAWKIEFDKKAKKEFVRLGKTTQKQIDKFILKLMKSTNPRQTGKALRGNFQSLWKYRIGNYRLICSIKDDIVTVLVLRVKHRNEVYKKDL